MAFDLDAIRRASPLERIVPTLSGESLCTHGRESHFRCPLHDDEHPSARLSVEKQVWFCDVCQKGGDVFDFVKAHERCSWKAAVQRLAERAGIAPNSAWNVTGRKEADKPAEALQRSPPRSIVRTYDYTDEHSEPLFQVVRFAPKAFKARRPDGRGGWIDSVDGVRRVLYGLPRLRGVTELPICAGEKDCETLWDLKLPATTNPFGERRWTQEDTQQLLRLGVRCVFVFEDNDNTGRARTDLVGRSCASAGLTVRVVRLPGLPPKGDVTDWIAAGHTRDELMARMKAAEPYVPDTARADMVGLPDLPQKGDVSDRLHAGHTRDERTTLVKQPPLITPPTRATASTEDSSQVPVLDLDLAGLLDALVTFVRRFVVMSDEAAIATALWVAHTYLFHVSDCTPYLIITSATKRAGKTRLFEVLECVVQRPWFTGRVSAAALLRKIDKEQPTLLLDESDAAFKFESDYTEAVRGLLNSGYRQGGKFSLCTGQGANLTVRDFSTYCPKAFAGIGNVLPDTVTDRSIPIELRRRAKGEVVERFRLRKSPIDAVPIRAALTRWATQAAPTLADIEPELPEQLNDRAQDVWEPLFIIAQHAGQDWPDRVRKAALTLVTQQPDDNDLGIELLKDIKEVLDDLPEGTEAIKTDTLLTELTAMIDRPWPTYGKNDKPLNPHNLARLLKPFKIVSAGRLTFPDDGRHRGYRIGAFDDAFARYLGFEVSKCPEPNKDGPKTAKMKCPETPSPDTSETPNSPINTGLGDTWTLQTPDLGTEPQNGPHDNQVIDDGDLI